MAVEQTEPELTPEEQKEFDRRDANYPFTSHGILEDMGVPVQDPNRATRRIIGREAAGRILDDLKRSGRELEAERAVQEAARRAQQDEDILKLLKDE